METEATDRMAPCREGYVRPYPYYRALSSKVLVVAVPGAIGDWTAYCDAVPGMSHRIEVEAVARHGNKVDKALAVVLFPDFDPKAYRV